MIKSNIEPHLGESLKLGCDAITSQVKFLQGKVLTIIDASFSDKEQKKAVKDLINKTFSDQLTYIWELCYPNTRMYTEDAANAIISDIDEIKKTAEIVE